MRKRQSKITTNKSITERFFPEMPFPLHKFIKQRDRTGWKSSVSFQGVALFADDA